MLLGLTIETAYHGPTNYRGSRISATCKRDSDTTYRKTVGYDPAINSDVNHHRAAEALMAEMDAALTYEGAEPFQIVARGFGGRSDAGYHFIINRGGA